MIVARITCDHRGCHRHFDAAEAGDGAVLRMNGSVIALGSVMTSGSWAAKQERETVRVYCAEHVKDAEHG